MSAKKILKSILHLTSHCKWAPGTAFQDAPPSVVNQNIINIKYKNKTLPYIKLRDHTGVYYCPQSSHHNCNVDHLGPIYPGQVLNVELCLPNNNEESGILYAETHNVNLPQSACKINGYRSVSHIFNNSQSKIVHFPIAAEQPGLCKLFLTAPPDLFYYYDVFDVHLPSCPLGFTLQHGVCDCDPYLRKYMDECSINDQTVTRPPNVYMCDGR